MKKTALLCVAACAALVVAFASCSAKAKLVGTWVGDEDEIWSISADGYVVFEGMRAAYTVGDTQITLTMDGESVAVDYSLSSDGKTLMLKNEWFGTYSMTKAPSPTALAENKWVSGTINADNTYFVYTIKAEAGTPYAIWVNDGSDGDETKTLDVEFNGFTEQGSTFYGDDGWNGPAEVVFPDEAGTITLVVSSYDDNDIGSFAIAYSVLPRDGSQTGPVRP